MHVIRQFVDTGPFDRRSSLSRRTIRVSITWRSILTLKGIACDRTPSTGGWAEWLARPRRTLRSSNLARRTSSFRGMSGSVALFDENVIFANVALLPLPSLKMTFR